MKKALLITWLFFSFSNSYSQLNLTGGVSMTKNNIDGEVLKQIIQQKQEEVFARLFSNIIVGYFKDKPLDKGVYNFPTYYALYNLVSDMTIGKTKTTVSKAILNSAVELAYIYSFVKYFESYQENSRGTVTQTTVDANKISTNKIVTSVKKDGEVITDKEKLKRLNFYMEAAFDVLAKDKTVQDKFYFKRQITSTEISTWYDKLGILNDPDFANESVINILGKSQKISELISDMKPQVASFLAYSGSDANLGNITKLTKTAIGLQTLKEGDINSVKLLLLEYANKTDFLFDHNVVKTLINLIVENTHFGLDENQKINQIYVDVEGLILSVDKEFITKNKKSSISSPVWFVNPRLFFTIGASTAFFLNNANSLDKEDGVVKPLRNVNLASEKIGFRIKVWDGGYTHGFSPGEVYRWHGKNYVWNRPQKKPLISSVYYNIYGSGLLYNVLNLKTNQNFDFGFASSNIGVIFFNGLEFSAGLGIVYKDGLDAKNSFFKLDFDIPIVDYLTALKNKKN